MPLCHIDFETRSACDLKQRGAAIYAEDPTTDILCVAFCVDDGPVSVISEQHCWPFHKDSTARILVDLARDELNIFAAHNAQFEISIWDKVMVRGFNFPEIALDRWKCTMAKAYAHGLPGGLGVAAKFLEIGEEKADSAEMKLLSAPRYVDCLEHGAVKWNKKKPLCCDLAEHVFWKYEDCPEKFESLYEYCKQDVVTERALDHALRDLNPKSQRVWTAYAKMNLEGFALDMTAINNACGFIEKQKEIDREDMSYATLGKVDSPTKRAKLKTFLNEDCELDAPNTAKATMLKLSRIEGLPDWVLDVVLLGGSGNKASLAKYPGMVKRSKGGILREYEQYHGAHTGRPAGKGVQLLNLARPKLDSNICADALVDLDFETFAFIYPKTAAAISYATRGMLIARPGRKLLMGDYVQIETMMLAWLAGEERTLEIFRKKLDVYCDFGTTLFGHEITKADDKKRQTAKMAVLGLGFGGAIGAFATTAKINDLDLMEVYELMRDGPTPFTQEELKNADYFYRTYYVGRATDPVGYEEGIVADVIKQRWRLANPNVVAYWKRLEAAAHQAMLNPGKRVMQDGLIWVRKPKFLFCKLRSGRLLAYPFPKLSPKGRKWDLHYLSARGRRSLYGGKIAENVTQATAHDVTEEAILAMPSGYDLRLDVYDELVYETKDGTLDAFLEVMGRVPEWAEGLPLRVEGHEGLRYRK